MSRKQRQGVLRDVRDTVNRGREADALAGNPDAWEGDAEARDPAEAFGNIAGKIAGLQGRALHLAAAGLAVAAALLIAFTLATAGLGGSGEAGSSAAGEAGPEATAGGVESPAAGAGADGGAGASGDATAEQEGEGGGDLG